MSNVRFNEAHYRDAKYYLDLALDNPNGMMDCGSKSNLAIWRHKLNKYRSTLRKLDAEKMAHIPGYIPSSPYDGIRLCQVNEAGESDKEGTRILFSHEVAMKANFIKADGTVITPKNLSLFGDEDA